MAAVRRGDRPEARAPRVGGSGRVVCVIGALAAAVVAVLAFLGAGFDVPRSIRAPWPTVTPLSERPRASAPPSDEPEVSLRPVDVAEASASPVAPSPSPSGSARPTPAATASLAPSLPEGFADPALWYEPEGEDSDLGPQLRLPLEVQGDGERVPVRGEIVLVWKGRIGNCLFQYAAARLLHALLGFELKIAREPGKLTGFFPDAGPKAALLRPAGWQPEGRAPDVKLARHTRWDPFEMALDRRERRVEIDSYCHFGFMLRHVMAAARRWYRLGGDEGGDGDGARTQAGDSVLHVRAGDISATSLDELSRGKGIGNMPLPLWYWEALLGGAGAPTEGGRVVVVTEPSGGAIAEQILGGRDGEVRSSDARTDFATLLRADRVLLSCSTFGWWAAALRRKAAVHFPLLGVCDPDFPIPNKGTEVIDYDAHITGWVFHDVLSMPGRPDGVSKKY